MEQVVYVDVLWLIDFSMDLLSLGLAGRIAQRTARPWRLCLAAGLGGLWSVLALLCGLDGIGGLVLDLAVAAGLCLLAYGRNSAGRFALIFGGFFFSTLLLGGSMTALANLFAEQTEQGISGGWFFLLALAGGGITVLGTHLRRRAAPRRMAVTVTLGERSVVLDGLSDSGNLVHDPISGRPVIFIAPHRLAALTDGRLYAALLSGRAEEMVGLSPEDARRICLVPLETVQGRALAPMLRPDGVTVGGKQTAALLCPMREGDKRAFDAILPADLLPNAGKRMNI